MQSLEHRWLRRGEGSICFALATWRAEARAKVSPRGGARPLKNPKPGPGFVPRCATVATALSVAWGGDARATEEKRPHSPPPLPPPPSLPPLLPPPPRPSPPPPLCTLLMQVLTSQLGGSVSQLALLLSYCRWLSWAQKIESVEGRYEGCEVLVQARNPRTRFDLRISL